MRIIILQGAFLPVPPLLGGAVEKIWFRLGQEFASAGHEVIQISRQYPPLEKEGTLYGVRHIRIAGYEISRNLLSLKWRDLCYTLRAIPHINRPASVIVTNTFWAPVFFPFLSKTPIYVDVACMPKGQMRLYARASRLRANSTAVQDAISREWPRAASKIRMIPNPLPFTPPLSLSLEHKTPTVLYAGRVHEQKGLVLLLTAWAQLPLKLIKHWKLQIAGPWQIAMGGSGEAFFAKLHSLAQGKNVEFLGLIKDTPSLNELYEKASIFVYPSLVKSGEAFGLAPLEAMAWGCVPLVSSMTSFKDFIQNNKNGIVFDHRATNAISLLVTQFLILMTQEEKRKEIASEAQKVSLSYAPSIIAKKFLEDFQSLQTKNKLIHTM